MRIWVDVFAYLEKPSTAMAFCHLRMALFAITVLLDCLSIFVAFCWACLTVFRLFQYLSCPVRERLRFTMSW